jgi:hypothetical protein
MSPPIRDGSGDSIGAIRLGDGSEIAEVRTGAGDVLFSAIPDIVDNFEVPDGPYGSNEDITDFYNGDTGAFERQQSTVTEGSFALRQFGANSNANMTSPTTGGLPNYPSRGDILEGFYYGGRDKTHSALITLSDNSSRGGILTDDCYAINFDYRSGEGKISLSNGGSETTLATSSTAPPKQEWLSWRFELSDPTLRFVASDSRDNQLWDISATDSTFTGDGGFGFGRQDLDSGKDSFWDGIVIQ